MEQLYCVIPAYNEEKSIADVIRKVRQVINNIIVIDDGSTDDTLNISLNEGVIVLKHIINRGQGAALRTGNEYALSKNADIIVHFDADGQFNAEEILDLIKFIRFGEADIVFGSRFLEKKSSIPFLKKNIILPIARIINFIFFGIKLTDPQSGFRALNRKASSKIKIENDGMAHCSEIISKSFRYKLRIKEVPISVKYYKYGQKFSGGLRILKDMLINKLLN